MRGMKEYKNKKNLKRRIYSKFVIFVFIVIIIILVRGTWGIYQKSKQSAQNLNVAKEKLEKLRDRQNSVADRVGSLRSEPGIEEEIRTRYDVAKEGEEIIIIVQGEDPPIVEEEAKGFKALLESMKSIFGN